VLSEIAVISVVETPNLFVWVMQKTNKSTILSQHKRAAENNTFGDKVKVRGLI